MKITITAIKADVGSIGGHTRPSDEMLRTVRTVVAEQGIASNLLLDSYIGYTGDDIHILMSHTRGTGNETIHKLAFDAVITSYSIHYTKLYECLRYRFDATDPYG